MGENDLKISKREFPDNKLKFLGKTLASPYENFHGLDDYRKPVGNTKKEDFFSNFKKYVHVMKK